MCVDVVDVFSVDIGLFQGCFYVVISIVVVYGWGGNVVGIVGQIVINDFGVDLGVMVYCVFVFFQYYNIGVFFYDKIVVGFIIGL